MKNKSVIIISTLCFIAITTVAQKTDTVFMRNGEFQPDSRIINVGDAIIWINEDTVIHTTTSGDSCMADGVWNSDTLQFGGHSVYTFTVPGNYPYFCIPHCSAGMTGSITAESNTSSAGAAADLNLKLTAFPNPAQNLTEIRFFLEKQTKVQLALSDISGKQQRILFDGEIAAGAQKISVSLKGLPAGAYFVQAVTDGKVAGTLKLTKLK